MRSVFRLLTQACGLGLLLVSLGSQALELPIIERVNSATYEIVVRKPAHDPLSYEKPLPLDLLPFQERNDKYYSVGTAFAVEANRFITAAHVFALHEASQFAGPFLRDAQGKIYEIDQIAKYSLHRDFAVFSLEKPPAGGVLEPNTAPTLNQKVFAVGNALGEGIIIRDGLYTSDTPEEQDGAWKWIRFSAAASPGNSGGPLLDTNGRVIGIVLRKSENENLNYALPIGEAIGAGQEADIDWSLIFSLDNIDASESVRLRKKIPLPKPLASLREELIGTLDTFSREAMQRLLSNNEFFPDGEASERLLNDVSSAVFPRLVMRGDDGKWDAYEPSDIHTADLRNNGELRYGQLANMWYGLIRKPDDVPLEKFYSEPKLFMDSMLKGMGARRQVGQQSVRITSLGEPERDDVHVDRYGRRWQVRVWAQPYNDRKTVTFALPVPGGYAFRFVTVPAAHEQDLTNDLALLSDFIYVSYYGTLAEWREFLAQRALLPAAFEKITLDADYGKQFAYRSERLNFAFDQKAMKISEKSDLELRFSYFRDGDKVRWDVCDVVFGENKHSGTFFSIERSPRPADSLDERRKNAWMDRLGKRTPFDNAVYYDDRKSFISAIYQQGVPQDPKVLYTLTLAADGTFPQEDMARRLGYFSSGVNVLEYAEAMTARP